MLRLAATAACAIALTAGTALAGGSSAFTVPPYAQQIQNPMVASETWELLRPDVIGDAEILDGEDVLSMDAPVTAYDPAVVPFAVRQADPSVRFKRLVVVVDENPAPIAADFELGPAMAELHLESRVRYDIYSNIRAIAQTEDGRTYMIGRFVQAAGGCTAAVSKDMAAALENVGQMKLKQFTGLVDPNAPKASGGIREAQVMIRHPNFTGMQVHTGTLDRIDPRFVELVEVKLGDELLFRMTGGFSLSENPSFRFKYRDNGATAITVRAVDTDGAEWLQSFPVAGGA